MSFPFVIVDVFTDAALAGNQLAVFPAGELVPEALLQPIAREIGFSETVYVHPGDRIRIFTPSVELPFAGHPVLGTAHVLATTRGTASVTLVTPKGPVELRHDGVSRARMVQPLPTTRPWGGDDAALLSAIGLDRALAPIDLYDNGAQHVFVVAPSVGAVAELRPDLQRVRCLLPDAGLSVFAGEGARWKTRMFFPGAGIAEDPATGSAVGPLAVHLARHGLAPWGEELTVLQGAELDRPSTLYVRAEGGPDGPTRVEVAGDSVIVGRGELDL
ncbi:MAG: PhzF family phenazine biosynthesis protein [Acidimicrobiales bacterium]